MSKQIKSRKKLRDTKFGQWLKEHDTELLDLLGDVIPNRGGWRLVKRIVEKLEELSDDKKQKIDELIALETENQD